MPVPDFSPGEVLTAAAMDSIGLWKVAEGTLSGSTTQFVGCFSSTYRNYRIVIDSVQTSASADIYFQFLSGTTPATTADYTFAYLGFTAAGGVVNANNTAATVGYTGISQNGANNTAVGQASMDIFSPNLTQRTMLISQAASFQTQWYMRMGSSHINLTTAYNGIQFTTAGAPTMGGTVRIYGYRN